MRRLLLAAIVSGCTAGAFAQQPDEPPAAAPAESATPMSDKEETGALTDLLPNRTDPLTLPSDGDDAGLTPQERAARSVASLFPTELWPGVTPLPADPSGLILSAPDADPSPAEETMSPEMLAGCFGPAPPPPLHDPQSLLSPAQAAALRALLRESLNARDSFQTSVIVLRPSWKIPVALNPSELLQRWHGNSKGLLVLYFLGQPERTQAFFSPATRRFHRSEDLRQVVDFGVREASRLTAPVAQLQRFCYKTAIRLDRLHRTGAFPYTEDAAAVAAVAAPVSALWWAFAVGVQAAAVAAGAVWWWRRRRTGSGGRKGEKLYFPEQDMVSRLGAPHSGGAGAASLFGAASPRL